MKTSSIRTAMLPKSGISSGPSVSTLLPASKPTSRWLKVNGVYLNYTEQGNKSGVPVIFLHGYSDSRISFDALLPLLPASLHVYAISMRGYGDSYKPEDGYNPGQMAKDVCGFMSRLNITQAIIIGHSLGTFVAQRFALDYPQKTKAVVLMSGFSSFATNELVKVLHEQVMNLQTVEPEFVKEFQNSTITRPVDPRYFKRLVAESMKVPLHVWQKTIDGFMEADFTSSLASVHQRVLILWGDHDAVCTRAEQEILRSSLPNASLQVLEGIGHAPHWEDPVLVAKHIRMFIESLELPFLK